MKEIYLIRHGESVGNAGKSTDDHRTMPLTERGREQARTLADHLTVVPDLIAVSPFTRAQQTSHPFQEKYPYVPVETWAESYEFTYLAPATCRNTTAVERLPRVTEYWENCNPDYVDGDGAESFKALVGRVNRTMAKLRERSEKRIFLFSHAMFITCCILLTKQPDLDWTNLMREFRQMSLLRNTELVHMKVNEVPVYDINKRTCQD